MNAPSAPAVSGDVPLRLADSEPVYLPRVQGHSLYESFRGLRHHARHWRTSGETRRCAVFLHGWMDSSVSWQFVVDALGPGWEVFAPDWRGFGLSERGGGDAYWFPDYLADLDQWLDRLGLRGPVDLVAHSMGGNAAMIYAGVRPDRVRRVVNLEGLGLRVTRPREAPQRYRQWLEQLREGKSLRPYPDRAAVAERLMRNNPRLRADRALFLAEHWSRPDGQGGFEVLGDPAHKIVNPVLYRVTEALACWRAVTADVLWVMAEHLAPSMRWALRPEYDRRLAVIRSLRRATLMGSGHMMQHDQPEALAALIGDFLG